MMRRNLALPDASEASVQVGIKRLLSMLGVAYYDTSQPFRALITPGVPDLIAFHQGRGLFFIEVKSRTGRQSKAQQQFETLCRRSGIPYILGGTQQVIDFLQAKDSPDEGSEIQRPGNAR